MRLNPPLENRKFDQALPGLSVFLRGRCPDLKHFRIDIGSLSFSMFAADGNWGNYTRVSAYDPCMSCDIIIRIASAHTCH